MRLRLALYLLVVSLVLSAQQRKNDVLISFFVKNNSYYAEIKRKGWDRTKEIRLCGQSAIEKVSSSSSLYQGESSKKTYSLIVKPLAKYLKRGDNIYFVPVGKIHFINLAALKDDSGKWLCDIYHFHRLSSQKEYPPTEDKPYRANWLLFGGMDYLADPEKMYAASKLSCHLHNVEHLYKDIVPNSNYGEMTFGVAEDGARAGYDNLDYSRGEIKDIWAMRSFSLIFESGFRATEEMFRFNIRQDEPYFVLLSTHSFISDNGAICGLLFSGAGHTIEGRKLPHNLNDGILYSQEIETLDMHAASLVVLAACNTGLGVVTQEGIQGLQTAFKKAGVKTLVMTLWSVNDRATAAFTTSLFKYLEKSKTKHEAFEKAVNDLRKSDFYSDPTYWAPFIMMD